MAKRQREEWLPGGALAGGLDAERRGRAGGDRPWDGRTAGPQRWVDGGDEASALTARAAARKAASVSRRGPRAGHVRGTVVCSGGRQQARSRSLGSGASVPISARPGGVPPGGRYPQNTWTARANAALRPRRCRDLAPREGPDAPPTPTPRSMTRSGCPAPWEALELDRGDLGTAARIY